ncbi:MAG: LamG domain-containing protein [Acidobacteriaceae bacterium]
MQSMLDRTIRACFLGALLTAVPGCGGAASPSQPTPTPASNTLVWKGHTWNITNGGMAGVAQGNPANVSIDQNGYVHLQIVGSGGTYTASEMFSQDNMGYGAYQWVIQGSIDNMDKSTVLGLFPYGPAAGIGKDGENELDIEFSKWNNTLCSGACNADFTFYPSTGNIGLGPTEKDFNINLNGGTLTTARLAWTSTSVTGTVMSGLQPIGTTANVLETWTFAPSDYAARIPQQPLPVGMNLWSFKVLPASNQEVVLQDFQFIPQ